MFLVIIHVSLFHKCRALYNDWQKVYWKLTDMVVPESSRSDHIFVNKPSQMAGILEDNARG